MKISNPGSSPQGGMDIRQFVEKLSIKELLELEELILRVIKKKIESENGGRLSQKEQDGWKEDFLNISVWSHLDNTNEVKVSAWKIEELSRTLRYLLSF